MERESHEGDGHIAREFGLTLQVVFFELFDEATDVLTLANSQCDFVLSTCSLNAGKWIVAIYAVVFRNDINPAFVLLHKVHAFEDAQNSAGDFFYAEEEFFVCRVTCRVESHRRFVTRYFPGALDMQGVEVDVKVHMSAESLDERHRSCFELSYFVLRIFFVEAPLHRFLDCSCNGRVHKPQDFPLKFGIAGAHIPEWHRHGEDPLANDGGGGEDVVGQVRSGFGHTAGSATSAKAALFAAEGDEPLVLAIDTPEAQESVSEYAALEKSLEFLRHM